MSWLATTPPVRTLGDALALRSDLHAGYRAFEATAADPTVIDPVLRAVYRRRIAVLVGGRPDPEAPSRTPSPAHAVVTELVEQIVLDPHGVTDELVERVRAHYTPREIVAIAQDAAVCEGLARLARLLDVRPEL